MIIDCISDLHGFYPQLPGGDLLIVAGDLTSRDTQAQHLRFLDWLSQQDYKNKIFIAGNHDNYLVGTKYIPIKNVGIEYLCDSGTEVQGVKVWGCPWTKKFPGQNKEAMAFTVESDFQLRDYFDLIPNDIDILITHTPPFGILDECANGSVGSQSLRDAMFRIKPKLMVFGHIHSCGGKTIDLVMTKCVNASHVNESYKPVNGYVRIDL